MIVGSHDEWLSVNHRAFEFLQLAHVIVTPRKHIEHEPAELRVRLGKAACEKVL
jgi:hypothetical protein